MTLILSYTTHNYVVQVSDRLVTSRRKEYDPRANKNVIYLSDDALVTIAYTGLSYLDGVPTDQWVARQLYGDDFRLEEDVFQGRRPPVPALNMGIAAKMLRARLDDAYPRLPKDWRGITTSVGFAGWQRHGLNAHEIIGVVAKPSADTPAEEWWRPRRWLRMGSHLHVLPTGHLSSDERRQLCDSLPGRGPDEAERLLVEAVQRVAARSDLVGPKCVAITIPHPRHRQVFARFHGELEKRQITTMSGTFDVGVWYSPWVVTPNGYVATSRQVGASSAVHDICAIRFEATQPADPDSPIIWAATGAPRKRPPR